METGEEVDNKDNAIYKKLESNNLISYKINNNNQIDKNFKLNEKEEKCFSTLINILKKNNLNSIICRVAGGWVRDKLLGKECDDIDITINDMKGSEFAKLINDEINPNQSKFGIFQQNLKKEKNIEVSNIELFNTSIDIVNLRCENINNIGTPLSDAEYRDITINSLFYNINEQKVEDFTQKGINHLEKGIIATPLEPEITLNYQSYFIILRILRFAVKFKFRIDNNLNNYIEKNSEIIKNKFYEKIANERIGKELLKIISDNNSAFAISYLYSFNILDIIFLIRNYDTKNKYDKIYLKITNLYILGEYLYKKEKLLDIEIGEDNFNKINYSLLLLTLYFRGFKKNGASLSQQIIKHTYKLGFAYQNIIYLIFKNFDNLYNIINRGNFDRLNIGKIIRKITYNNIIPILYLLISYEYIEKNELNSILNEINNDALQIIISKYKMFLNYLIEEDMLRLDQIQPLLKGKEIIDILNIKSNKEIQILNEFLIEEQIKNPKLNKIEAMELLKKKKNEITSNNIK